MTNFSGPEIAAIVSAYDFSGIGTLVDVAGGHGSLLSAILKANPAMKGVLADMLAVSSKARAVTSRLPTSRIDAKWRRSIFSNPYRPSATHT